MLPPSHNLQPTLKKYLAITLNHLGNVNRDKGNVIAALDYFQKSLKIYEDLKLLSWIGTIYNNMANTYSDIGDLDKATELMEKAMALLIRSGDEEEIMNSYINLGYFYYLGNKKSKALNLYNKGLILAQKNKITYYEALALDRIGQLHASRTQYKEAMDCYERSLTLGRQTNRPRLLASTLNNIGECYRLQKKYNKALGFSEQSLKISQEIGNTIRIRNAALSLKLIYENLKNYSSALKMHELYILMRDSTNNELIHKKSLKKQLDFEYEKKEIVLKEERNKLNTLYVQKQKYYSIITVVLIILGVIIIVSIYFRYKLKREEESNVLNRKLKEQLKSEIEEKESIANSIIHIQEQEREKLAAELHDGVNQLLFAAKIQMQAAKSTEEQMHRDAVKLVETAIQEIRSIAGNQGSFILHDKKLSDALTDLVLHMKSNREIAIAFLNKGLDEDKLNAQQKTNILRIIQELLNNAIKHAGARQCYISIKTSADKIQIAVTDSGVGLKKNVNTTGNGLKNINNKVALMKGVWRLFSIPGKGTKVYIQIPLTSS